MTNCLKFSNERLEFNIKDKTTHVLEQKKQDLINKDNKRHRKKKNIKIYPINYMNATKSRNLIWR